MTKRAAACRYASRHRSCYSPHGRARTIRRPGTLDRCPSRSDCRISKLLSQEPPEWVGPHVVDLLLVRGETVVAVDNFLTSARSNLNHLADHPQLTRIQSDVCDIDDVSGTVDTVLHLASPASPRHFVSLPLRSSVSAASASSKCSNWRNVKRRGSPLPAATRATPTPMFIRNMRGTRRKFISVGLEPATTSQNGSVKRPPTHSTELPDSIRESCASSTHMNHARARTTVASCPISSSKHWRVSHSRLTATAFRLKATARWGISPENSYRPWTRKSSNLSTWATRLSTRLYLHGNAHPRPSTSPPHHPCTARRPAMTRPDVGPTSIERRNSSTGDRRGPSMPGSIVPSLISGRSSRHERMLLLRFIRPFGGRVRLGLE